MNEDYPEKIMVEAQDALWRNIMAPLYEARPIAENDALQGKVDSRILGQTLIGHARYRRHLCTRDMKLINSGGINQILLQIILKGNFSGRFGETEIRGAPGDIIIMDYSRPFDLLVSDGSTISFAFDRILISRIIEPRSLHGLVIKGETPLGKILSNLIKTALSISDSINVKDKLSLESDILEFMAKQLSRSTEKAALSNELQRQAIIDYIDKNVFDYKLSPTTLQERFRLSRSNLYRFFDEYGGVRKMIWDRRLKAAYQEIIQSPPDKKISMKTLAYKCGCTDTAQFRERFVKYYNCKPADIMRTDIAFRPLNGELMNIQKHFGSLEPLSQIDHT